MMMCQLSRSYISRALTTSRNFFAPFSCQQSVRTVKRLGLRNHFAGSSDIEDSDRCSIKIAELEEKIRNLEKEINETVEMAKGKDNDFLRNKETSLRSAAECSRNEKQRLQIQQENLAARRQEMIEELKGKGLVGTPVRRESEEGNDQIEDGELHFVNRENAVGQLQDIHRKNYSRALLLNGREWVIPICDNVFGMGKTRLAQKYIKRSQANTLSCVGASSKVKETRINARFRDALNRALTVHITFAEAELQYQDTFEMTLMRKLRDKLIELFEVAPVCLYKSYTTTQIFLSALIVEAGPLFIALDEIGAAFTVEGKNDIDRRELFLRFCAKVLGSWLLVPGLFFLVLGRGSFLSYVGNRPDNVNIISVSPFSFKRLSLQLLRTEAIVEILKKTHVGESTLYNYYKLSPEKAEEVAKFLFQQTTGNPRHLLDAFERCETYEQLMKYDESFVIQDYEKFCEYVSKYLRPVQSLLSAAESKSIVDLREEVTSKGRSITLEIIANNVLIAWEGRLEAAQLVASPTIINFMATSYYPFKQYLGLITKLLDGPLNFPEAFEIMLMKRFQEMFASPSCPKDILPSFFDSPEFGQIPDFVCCSLVRRMGKVISTGSGMKLEGLTINMDFWPLLIGQMDSFKSLCLKPLPLSASSDIFFVGDVYCGSILRRCTVGVAAKNYGKKKNRSRTICH
mmetsp:Transcript_42109/g.88040  ORF Transcript_42109/g.88040 Transcript_42109/m.88040 type:complete len:685 (+) Transcript_42109:3-2057(+)